MGEVAKQVGQIVNDLAGPAAKELGQMLRDEIRPYRARRQVALLQKTEKMLQEAKTPILAVEPKVLLTIVDNAGIEDDEGLHTMWAALLANAATEERGISPIFPEILRQMSPSDGLILQAFEKATYDGITTSYRLGTENYVVRTFADRFERERIIESIQNLLHLSILTVYEYQSREDTEDGGLLIGILPLLHISPFGQRFLKACQPPKKAQAAS